MNIFFQVVSLVARANNIQSVRGVTYATRAHRARAQSGQDFRGANITGMSLGPSTATRRPVSDCQISEFLIAVHRWTLSRARRPDVSWARSPRTIVMSQMTIGVPPEKTTKKFMFGLM